MRIVLLDEYGAFLTRAQPAAQLCLRILEQSALEPVVLDFSGVLQLSPSFANVLFFNLLHQMSPDDLRLRIRVENAAPHILDAINTAIACKAEHRAELTSYLAG
jgi:hypothetical protein